MEHALSVGQNALWLIHRMAPETSAYNVAWSMRFRGPVDVAALVRAVELTVERHDMLRSVFTEIEGVPRRIVRDAGFVEMRLRTAHGASDEEVVKLVEAEIAKPFRLDDEGNCRFVHYEIGPQDYVFIFVQHHIATDFNSLARTMQDVLAAYTALRDGGKPDWTPLTESYADFVAAERELIESSRLHEMAEYWRGMLQGAPTQLELPLDRPRPAHHRFSGAVHKFQLPRDVVDGIIKGARASRVTPVRHMLGVFQALLYRCSTQSDFLLGCDSSSSMSLAGRGVPGYYSNKVVLRARCTSSTTFRELIGDVNQQLAGASTNGDFPYAMLQQALGLPSRGGVQSLVQVGVSMITIDPRDPLLKLANNPEIDIEVDGVRISGLDLPQQAGQCDLVLEVIRSKGAVRCVLKYDTDIFTAATVRRMADHFVRLLRAAAADPDQRVAGVSLVDENERARLLAFATGRHHTPKGEI